MLHSFTWSNQITIKLKENWKKKQKTSWKRTFDIMQTKTLKNKFGLYWGSSVISPCLVIAGMKR